MEVKQDCLIGSEILPENIKSMTSQTIEYFEQTVGNVKVTLAAYNELLTGEYDRYIIGGITRLAFENKIDPPLIDSTFIRDGYKNLNPPTDFKDNARHISEIQCWNNPEPYLQN